MMGSWLGGHCYVNQELKELVQFVFHKFPLSKIFALELCVATRNNLLGDKGLDEIRPIQVSGPARLELCECWRLGVG